MVPELGRCSFNSEMNGRGGDVKAKQYEKSLRVTGTEADTPCSSLASKNWDVTPVFDGRDHHRWLYLGSRLNSAGSIPLRRTRRCWMITNAHRANSARIRRPERAIAVTDEVDRRLVPRESFRHLIGDPLGRNSNWCPKRTCDLSRGDYIWGEIR